MQRTKNTFKYVLRSPIQCETKFINHSKPKTRNKDHFPPVLPRLPTQPSSAKRPAAPPPPGRHLVPVVLNVHHVFFTCSWTTGHISGRAVDEQLHQVTKGQRLRPARAYHSVTPHTTQGRREGLGACRYGLLPRTLTTTTASHLSAWRW